MRDIAAIEVSVLVDELRDTFATAYYKNFYELEENRFLLTISKERKEHAINIRLLKTINETEYKETAERASEFALTVRKKLDGCRVESIEQHAADRIVIISFSGKNELRLILEMLDKGNLLLVNKEGVIEVVYTSRSYRDRNIRRGAVYVFPKSEALKLKEIGQEDAAAISEKLKCSEQKLIVAISKHVNAGPLYLENAINNAGLDANKPASAQELGGDEVAHMINELQESLRKPEPRIYIREGEPLDFAITAIAKYESNTELKTETFESLNKLLDALYLKERSTSIDTGKVREIEELNASIGKLHAQIDELKVKGVECKSIGNKIFERMDEINRMLEQLRKIKAKDDEVGKKFGNIRIKGVNQKRKAVSVEIE